jgi:hypothetical protein
MNIAKRRRFPRNQACLKNTSDRSAWAYQSATLIEKRAMQTMEAANVRDDRSARGRQTFPQHRLSRSCFSNRDFGGAGLQAGCLWQYRRRRLRVRSTSDKTDCSQVNSFPTASSESVIMSMPTDQSKPAAEIAAVNSAAESPRDIRPTVQVDDSRASSCYANFCRVTGTPEEIIIDFGLNPQPFGTPTAPIAISERIVCNYYTAKRMLAALGMTIQRHEAVFGVLETDVQKRAGSPQR